MANPKDPKPNKRDPHAAPEPTDESVTGVTNPGDRPEDQIEEEEKRLRREREKDAVQESSEESFPASDPPSWTPEHA